MSLLGRIPDGALSPLRTPTTPPAATRLAPLATLELSRQRAAGLEAIRATKALREAVEALEGIYGVTAGHVAHGMAATAILRVREALEDELC